MRSRGSILLFLFEHRNRKFNLQCHAAFGFYHSRHVKKSGQLIAFAHLDRDFVARKNHRFKLCIFHAAQNRRAVFKTRRSRRLRLFHEINRSRLKNTLAKQNARSQRRVWIMPAVKILVPVKFAGTDNAVLFHRNHLIDEQKRRTVRNTI